MPNEPAYIVVIGASAGGLNALFEFVSHLSPDADAAYFIVLHLSTRSIGSYLAHRLQERTKLKSILAMDGLPIQKGYIYVAVPNHHLIMTDTEVKISAGPLENRWRPSIDVLFRSAATHFTNRVIGIILTGLLNDGTTGMSSIKRVGGKTIVQDPNEAEYPDMPISVLNAIEVDYCVQLSEMGKILKELTSKPVEVVNRDVPKDLKQESEIFETLKTDIKTQMEYGDTTPYSCPDCGGVLFLHKQDAITKFKCHIGHSYTTRDLLFRQTEEVEESLWYAIRSMEQRKNLLESLVAKYTRIGSTTMVTNFQKSLDDLQGHINNLKTIIAASLNFPEED
jgi:two-component system chemotaxis response regulator CheB